MFHVIESDHDRFNNAMTHDNNKTTKTAYQQSQIYISVSISNVSQVFHYMYTIYFLYFPIIKLNARRHKSDHDRFNNAMTHGKNKTTQTAYEPNAGEFLLFASREPVLSFVFDLHLKILHDATANIRSAV
jgi:hypothetical protein